MQSTIFFKILYFKTHYFAQNHTIKLIIRITCTFRTESGHHATAKPLYRLASIFKMMDVFHSIGKIEKQNETKGFFLTKSDYR